MLLTSDGLLRTCQTMSFIESWYAIFESLEVDGVFFDEIGMDFADIGRRGRCCLHVQNLQMFFTIWFLSNSWFMIMSIRSSYAFVEILCLWIQQNKAAVIKSWKYSAKLLLKCGKLFSSNTILTKCFSSDKGSKSFSSEDVVYPSSLSDDVSSVV